MTKIVHVIGELTAGGAEEMLYKLLEAERGGTRTSRVVSLTGVGPVGIRIAALGIPVVGLGMRRGRPNPAALVALLRLLRRERPDLVQTWMYHADLLGGAAATLLHIPVVWGVRHDDSKDDKALTRLTRRLCALLSPWLPEAVIFNSEAACRSHARAGYAERKLLVIPNGFDLSRFRPDPAARGAVRRELGVPEGAQLVGLAARFHPDKGHEAFVAAASIVHRRCDAARFVLCGEGVDWENRQLAGWLDREGLRSRSHLLGDRADVERILAALDVACLTSRTESFPSVLAEAMACGVPCVATDCGDARAILGAAGTVVPRGDPAAFARAVLDHLGREREARAALGALARRRVKEAYDLDVVARRFQDVQDRAIRSCAG